MRIHSLAAGLAAAFPIAASAVHDLPAKDLGVVNVTGSAPTSLPTQVPTTTESITREQVERSVNATDSEDALKYFPSLLVRKRYVGDYNHAILSSRASGTGNSARSAVYADGILLSNFLGNGVGGLSFPPRWGLVTPEEIERVDVMYGPFSAAYPGNSVGAVVDYVTRMPTKLEGHVTLGYSTQAFDLYATRERLPAWQAGASLGSKAGDWSWWFTLHRTDSRSQPLTFASRQGTASPGAGAVAGRSPTNAPLFYVAAQTQSDTVQDHAKAKVAYDITSTLRASALLGWWTNRATGRSTSYLQDASLLTGADLPRTDESLMHAMQGLSLKQHTQGTWDWELAASHYGYLRDTKRQNAAANPPPQALAGGPGTLADGSGTGWTTLSARGTWRPQGLRGAHILDAGVQQDRYVLQYVTSTLAGNWRSDAAGPVASDVGGRTALRSAWAQDSWRFAPRWKTVLGLRAEEWTASDGRTRIATATPAVETDWPQRRERHLSPKAALSWQASDATILKASLGRAVRFPTVAELYGATSTTNSQFINDPSLRPERSWTGELTAERMLGHATVRVTAFAETTRDALYTQLGFDPAANRNVGRVSNVGRIATRGLELAGSGEDVGLRGLDLSGGITYAQSVIEENAGFVALPGDTIGKRQPNIPRWRANALAAYRWTPAFTTSVGARSSSRQFRTLDNSDINGATYTGVSRFFVVDLRAQWKVDKTFTLAAGIDNVGNATSWNFHPYPQRTVVADLRADF